MGQPRLDNLPHYTWNDYLQWEGKWELIDGIPYAMSPAPTIEHQAISARLARLFDEALQGCSECMTLLPVDWKIEDDIVVQPDNLIVCGEVSGTYLDKAPVLLVEILSPSTAHKDKSTKFELYQQQGVRYYLIIDPLSQTIDVFDLVDGNYQQRQCEADQILDFSITETCMMRLDTARIWA